MSQLSENLPYISDPYYKKHPHFTFYSACRFYQKKSPCIIPIKAKTREFLKHFFTVPPPAAAEALLSARSSDTLHLSSETLSRCLRKFHRCRAIASPHG